MMLEEEHLVTPKRSGSLRSGDNVTDEFLVSTMLRRHVVTEHFEHNGVCWNVAHLVEEVVLVLIFPAVDIIWLDLDLERPMGIFLLIAVLIEFNDFHD